jgi:hypothetical protein
MALKLAQRKFLTAFSQCGRICEAAETARIAKRDHWGWLDDPEYKAAFEGARDKAVEHFEDELVKRAVAGDEEYVVYQGKLCKEEVVDPQTGEVTEQLLKIKRKSDVLLMFLLKKLDPAYRENSKVEVGGAGDGPLQIEIIRVKPGEVSE